MNHSLVRQIIAIQLNCFRILQEWLVVGGVSVAIFSISVIIIKEGIHDHMEVNGCAQICSGERNLSFNEIHLEPS